MYARKQLFLVCVLCASLFIKWMYTVQRESLSEDSQTLPEPNLPIWSAIGVHQCGYLFTAKTQYRQIETSVPRKGIAEPQSQFPHSCVCERFLYSHNRSAYSDAGKYVDRSWENKSLTDTWMWKLDWGRVHPFLGTHKWDFSCNVPVD